MLTLTSEAARAALPFDRLIAALREHFTTTCEVPLRHVHEIASPGGKITSLIMPAWLPGRYYGV
ncbi:MAG: ornithine cyclodeaminase family protein, partial [Hydrogenophaga sp.]|nr:ornithine cyclodeaminase family protein [Hydrogenophaga sp.]